MKKIVKLTESDLMRIVKRVINEQPSSNLDKKDPEKTDCRTNSYWKQLEPKLLSLGFKKNEKHHKYKGFIFGPDYPDYDFYECTMTHPQGVSISYPLFWPDYTGDYYSNFVDVQNLGFDSNKLKNTSCLGRVPDEDGSYLKVSCIDYILQLAKESIKKKMKPLYPY